MILMTEHFNLAIHRNLENCKWFY